MIATPRHPLRAGSPARWLLLCALAGPACAPGAQSTDRGRTTAGTGAGFAQAGQGAGVGSPGFGTAGLGPAAGSGGLGASGKTGSQGFSGQSGVINQAGTAALVAGTGVPVAGATAVSNVPPGACQASMDRLRISEVDVGTSVVANEDEVALKPIVIAPMTTMGSRVAFMGSDGMIHIVQLDASDKITGSPTALAGFDFDALQADDAGGAVLLTRAAHGSGDKHCGTLSNLCGSTASLPSQYSCFDMYLVRFDGATETWATQLTQSSDTRPPYLNSPTDTQSTVYIWETYAHHGRIAYDGTNYAAYYGAAISVTQACVNSDSALKNAVNIHQGDEMRIVDPTGAVVKSANAFDWGCSHSGFERVLWDPAGKKFVPICKTDNSNRIAIAPKYTTVLPVDLNYADVGNLTNASNGGYWLTVSNLQTGQPAMAAGFAQVLLLHFGTGMADKNISLANDATLNQRAPHLAAYGPSRMLAGWESSTAKGDLTKFDKTRQFHLQVLDSASGAVEGPALQVAFTGNRYQDLVPFPDGSVAFTAPGSSATKIKILRVLPCN